MHVTVLIVMGAGGACTQTVPADPERYTVKEQTEVAPTPSVSDVVDEKELLKRAGVPENLDVVGIAKEAAALHMKVSKSRLTVKNVARLTNESGLRKGIQDWICAVERSPSVFGSSCLVYISDDGEVVDYEPGN